MHKLFEVILEIFGWCRIVASPLLLGMLLGGSIYSCLPNSTTLAVGVLLSIIGLIIGIIWATGVYKSKHGTIWFLSGIINNSADEPIA